MDFLRSALKRCTEYKAVHSALKSGRTPIMASSLSRVHKANIIDTLPADENRRALVVVADDGEAARLKDDLAMLGRDALIFPARDLNLRKVEGISHEYELERVGVLCDIISGNADTVIASAEAIMKYTVPREVLSSHLVTIDINSQIGIDGLCRLLNSSGYTRCQTVDGKGQFAVRGGIVDIFIPSYDNPVRIEFWGDDIDSLKLFDIESQRRVDDVDSVTVTPAREVTVDSVDELIAKMTAKAKALSAKSDKAKASLYADIDALNGGLSLSNIDKYIPFIYDNPETLFDYMDGAVVFMYEPSRIYESVKSYAWQQSEEIKSLFEDGALCRGLDKYAYSANELYVRLSGCDTVMLETFTASSGVVQPKTAISFSLPSGSSWGGMAAELAEDINAALDKGCSCVVLNGSERAAMSLCDTLSEHDIAATYLPNVPEDLPKKSVVVSGGTLPSSAEFPEAGICVFTHGRGAAKQRRRKKYSGKGQAIGSLDELHKGDLVVHSVHGIGVFDGINKIESGGVIKDYIKIKYLKDDVLYVPVTQLDLVSRYIGASENGNVKLNRLGSDQWIKTKQRVKGVVRDMAKELIALYAKRAQTVGYKFSPDSDLQHDFEYRFPYEETEDQLKCADEIKNDMQKPIPMERLLCGDVGFGKTEVALRAAFKCVCDGKQCAILVPTTILAWQHYKTVLQRMEQFPVNVEMLSRFRTAGQQTEIKKKLKRGEIDIIVGTHRLISNDVQFRDLGLLIIDEEQRFGVAQKEKLKQLYPNVDVLTLSATPIPRTLNMAMSGLRDMSVIEEAPLDRHPVQTYVLEYDKGVLLGAIRKELGRGGQVYYIYNRVETISRVAAMIQTELPDANVAIAHGQMSEEELSDVWRRLIDHEIDVLVCTTIIETGVDVPNVNTLIIENADRFGLSQLHQLRGRVGRSSRRAYAYLTYKRGKALSDVAQKRLQAIREYTEFGSGFKIAMRDLEIRGAGNMLGAKQHGQMEAVGYDMYIKLLSDAIKAQKGEAPESPPECTVDLQIGAHIPEDYIEDLPARLQIYRRIAQIRTSDDASDVTDELIDRFGEPPSAVLGLIEIAQLRNRAAALKITEVSDKMGDMRVYFSYFELEDIAQLIKKYNGRATVLGGDKPFVSVKKLKTQKIADEFREFLAAYETIMKKEVENNASDT